MLYYVIYSFSYFKEKIDEVDDYLAKQDGKIVREKDPRMCHHGTRQKCTHCLPLDPYDEDYLKKKDIKHMSFHAYVRKMTAGHGKGTQLKKPLENIVCSLKPNCPGHKPYPQGICSKCRPPMVTLNRQRFRHVDNISIENEDVVNRFLAFWRKTGNQRIGYMIGRYESFQEIPLGIKATVAAIYEPPQSCSTDSVSLEADPQEKLVDELCSYLNLKRVGWIFTDLWSADSSKGTVCCTRHKDSFFLTAQECITAGWLQNKYPNITNFCTDGYFGSKFTTVVASGNEWNQIDFSGYQVSNQCASLVAANLLCPTSHPELAYLREVPLTPSQYITDVYYMEKNEYGVETRKNGRPMPVEYLLVDVPAGMPKEPHATFNISKKCYFPTENRILIGELQDSKTVGRYISEFSQNQFIELATNFHFLLFLLNNDIVKFSKEEVKSLCDIVQQQDRAKAMEWASNNINWATLSTLCLHSLQGEIARFSANFQEYFKKLSAAESSNKWSCKHCTFENSMGRIDCSMCGLPRSET
uniref:NPL4 domain-containing protein n=1 Tax=Elaeophora elaphi TaxID=1147741 RepID=A0A0R3RTM0_9BILA